MFFSGGRDLQMGSRTINIFTIYSTLPVFTFLIIYVILYKNDYLSVLEKLKTHFLIYISRFEQIKTRLRIWPNINYIFFNIMTYKYENEVAKNEKRENKWQCLRKIIDKEMCLLSFPNVFRTNIIFINVTILYINIALPCKKKLIEI